MEAVWLHSLAQWGASQSEQYIEDLTEAFEFLADNPKAGTACDQIRQHYRRHPVIRHVIYYRATNYGIEVMRILHDRMLAARHL